MNNNFCDIIYSKICVLLVEVDRKIKLIYSFIKVLKLVLEHLKINEVKSQNLF